MSILPRMEERDIEFFLRSGPDQYNGQSATGDPAYVDPVNGDWSPTFMRAMTLHLGLFAGVEKTFNPPPTIVLGRRGTYIYNVQRSIPLFASLRGEYPEVELRFASANVGVSCLAFHYPDAGGDNGTYRPEFGYATPPGMTNWVGYGSNPDVFVERVLVRCAGSVPDGTVGIAVYRRAQIREVEVRDAPWHAIQVVADVTATPVSNANGTRITDVRLLRYGLRPGNDSARVTTFNPNGFRGYGWGLAMSGGDGNICVTQAVNSEAGARGGIADFAFLGNVHVQPDTDMAPGSQAYTQAELDIYDAAGAWLTANPGGDAGITAQANYCRRWMHPRGHAVSDPWSVVYVATDPNATSFWVNPYGEGDADVWLDGRHMYFGGSVNDNRGDGTAIRGRRIRGYMTHEPRDPFTGTQWLQIIMGRASNIVQSLSDGAGNELYTQFLNNLWYRIYNIGGAITDVVSNGGSYGGRVIERGRLIIDQAMHFRNVRFNVTATDPSDVTPSASGSFRAHYEGPGDRPGDLALWTGASFAPGTPFLFMCVGTVGVDATWEPLLIVPTP